MNKNKENSGTPVKITKDGSTTLYSKRFDQYYHNPNGAVAESRHVFFETPGLPDFLTENKVINIFEVGFGSGLNLILLMDYLKKTNQPVKANFYSIEAFPVNSETAMQLNFGDELSYLKPNERLKEIFRKLQPGQNIFSLNEHININLFVSLFDDLTDHDFESVEPIDFIFHDAFSPDVNPDLWQPNVFEKLKALCRPDAVLSTYCAASSARAAMAVAGWYPARAKGAVGKREMTVASTSQEKLKPFKKMNHERLTERYRRGDFD